MKRFTFGVLTASLLCAGCLDSTAPPAFAISATVDRATAAPGDSVTFVVQASGNDLVRLGIDFGDGNRFDRDLFGAQTVTANRRHAYAAPGQYTMTATVLAAGNESRQTMLGVTVR